MAAPTAPAAGRRPGGAERIPGRTHSHSARAAGQSTSQAGSHFRTTTRTCASVPSA
jgi:hypothetical protein